MTEIVLFLVILNEIGSIAECDFGNALIFMPAREISSSFFISFINLLFDFGFLHKNAKEKYARIRK